MKIIIKGSRLINPASGFDGSAVIVIENGIFTSIGAGCCDASGDLVIDGTGLVAAPGLVDMHVHLREPGYEYKEDIHSGCRAAAAGGVTSLLAMPNTRPVADCGNVIRYVLERGKSADAHVYAVGAVSRGLLGKEPADLAELKAAGAIAVSDDGRPVVSARMLGEAMRRAASLGLVFAAHCEDLELAGDGKINLGAVSRQLGVPGIPASAENCGVAREIAIALSEDVPVHICHVSTKVAVDLVRFAKRAGGKVTAETCPHYFILTEKFLRSMDADYRMNPPLRTDVDRLAVIEGLSDGTIDAIVTDHAPHSPEEKGHGGIMSAEAMQEAFLSAPNGVVGLETSLAAGITWLVNEGHIMLTKLIALMSSAPARILGIPAGNVAAGKPADIVLFDPLEAFTADPEKLHGKSKNTPFKGMRLSGRVKLTICGGRVVFDTI